MAENEALIALIKDFGNKGRLDECVKLQAVVQRNLFDLLEMAQQHNCIIFFFFKKKKERKIFFIFKKTFITFFKPIKFTLKYYQKFSTISYLFSLSIFSINMKPIF